MGFHAMIGLDAGLDLFFLGRRPSGIGLCTKTKTSFDLGVGSHASEPELQKNTFEVEKPARSP